MARIRLLSWVLLTLLGWVAPARAEEAQKSVVMVVDPSVLPIARRLTLEIEGLGLTVQLIDASSLQASFLKDQALAAGAIASIHLAPAGGGDVEMAILDRASGNTVNWRVSAPTADEPAPLDLIATRTVELLRASLLELATRRAAEAEARARTRNARELAPKPQHERRAQLSLSLAPAFLYSPHLRPSVLLQSSAVWLPLPYFGLEFSALVPAVGARLATTRGTVDLFASLYRLGPVLALGNGASPVSLRFATGLELDWLHFQGTALSPYLSARQTRTAWSPFVAVTTRFRVASGGYVFTELAAAFAFPSTVVRIAGDEVTHWGLPLATAAIGVELCWPSGGFE